MRRASMFPALLLSLLPSLMLYAHNAAQLHLRQLVSPLLLASGAAILLTALLNLWLRRLPVAAIVSGVVCFLLQIFGVVTTGLTGLGLPVMPARWVAACTLLALLIATVAMVLRVCRRPQSQQTLHRRFLWVGLLFVLVQIGRIGIVEWQSRQASAVRPSRVAGVHPQPAADGLPDIYFILLDGYGSSDVLHDVYGYDNSEFLETLQSLGFHVSQKSRANYVGTLWALASILNMDYLQQLLEVDPGLKQMNPLIRLVRNNRVAHELRGLGYKTVVLASGYGVAEIGKPDVYLDVPQGMNDFEQMLFEMTVFSLWTSSRSDAHHQHRRRLTWAFETLGNVPESESPRFVFAHILAPHPPFVFDAVGRPVQDGGRFALNDGSDYYGLGHTREQYVEGYAQQARWVTEQVQEAIQKLLSRSENQPVVVLMSDHGPGAGLDWHSAEETDLLERFGVLHALLLPDTEGLQLPQDLSPVATFRLLFDLYFERTMGPLPTRSYFSTKDRPYDFQDVTDLLTKSP